MSALHPLEQRKQRIDAAANELFDLVIIGGGIHGAAACREAALRGHRVLLLEAGDYAGGTSSRSSKMLHGGVRYLEQGNVSLVFEALRERARMMRAAPHLTRRQSFLFPIISKKTKPKWMVRLGLWLYDLLTFFSRTSSEAFFPQCEVFSHSSETSQELEKLGLKHKALLRYFDGQMDDARLVIENILDAESLNAVSLNYARVEGIEREDGDSKWTLRWTCQLTGQEHISRAKFLLNAAGPAVESVHSLFSTWHSQWPKAVFSRGVHLLFNRPWTLGGLILPTGERGRYYFVWPYFSSSGEATLVGTTDQQTSIPEPNPQATTEEVEELVRYLERDLPHAQLTRETLYQTFCGIRTLVSKGQVGKVSELSRSEMFLDEDYYIAMIGGKFTTSRATAEKFIDRFELKSSKKKSSLSTRSRSFPGGRDWSVDAEQALQLDIVSQLRLADEALSEQSAVEIADLLLSRFGMQAGQCAALACAEDRLHENSSKLAANRLSARHCILYEQAVYLEDLARRRLSLLLQGDTSEEDLALIGTELVKNGITGVEALRQAIGKIWQARIVVNPIKDS